MHLLCRFSWTWCVKLTRRVRSKTTKPKRKGPSVLCCRNTIRKLFFHFLVITLPYDTSCSFNFKTWWISKAILHSAFRSYFICFLYVFYCIVTSFFFHTASFHLQHHGIQWKSSQPSVCCINIIQERGALKLLNIFSHFAYCGRLIEVQTQSLGFYCLCFCLFFFHPSIPHSNSFITLSCSLDYFSYLRPNSTQVNW